MKLYDLLQFGVCVFSILAADGRHVASPYLLEPAYVVGSHFCLRGIIEE